MDHMKEFRADVTSGRPVVIVGAGVSVASTQGEETSDWIGLLRHGVRYASASGTLDAAMAELCLDILNETESSARDLLEVADIIEAALGGRQSGNFQRWISVTAGSFQVSDASVLRAILSLGMPILTTNYDTLLEKAGGLDSTTWRNAPMFQEVVVGTRRAIAHIHGIHTEASSVILSANSYDQLLEDTAFKLIRDSMAVASVVIYVGFGEGIADPNFASLRKFVSSTLPTSSLRHYRLCRQVDVERLTLEHQDEQLTPIAYGSKFEHLAPFLESLAPQAPDVPSAPGGLGHDHLSEIVLNGAVLTPRNVDPDARPQVSDLLIPPVLLAVSRETYLRSREGRSVDENRLDPEEVVADRAIVVAGDENSGVSSALYWLLSERHRRQPEEVPLVIDYRTIREQGKHPLTRAIRQQLRLAGIAISDAAPLPPLALAIDNFEVGNEKLLNWIQSELADLPHNFLAVGCRPNAEAEAHRRLASLLEEDVRLCSIGRMGREDVRLLCTRADLVQSERVTSRAVSIVLDHHLPATPFTFGMVISALIQGDAMVSATTQTGLLDRYLSLLLGWLEKSDDSRTGMSSKNRTYLMGLLAELYVEKQTGSLPQGEVVSAIGSFIERLEWDFVPVDILLDLRARRILVLRGNEVSFAQSSYLHMFAAKRAEEDKAFLAKLVRNPLFFAPIIKHYAALRQSDSELLHQMGDVLGEYGELLPGVSAAFAVDPAVGKVGAPASSFAEWERRGNMLAEVPQPHELEQEALAFRDEKDIEPFPSDKLDDAPLAAKMARTLNLVSSVLRDTEMVEDPAFRRELLVRTLRGWANLIYALEEDDSFRAFANEFAQAVIKDLGAEGEEAREIQEAIFSSIPIGMVVGGITNALSSSKLGIPLANAVDHGMLPGSDGLAFASLILALDIQNRDWVSYASVVMEQLLPETSAAEVLTGLLHQALIEERVAKSSENVVLRMLALQSSAVRTSKKAGAVEDEMESIRRALVRPRMRRRARELTSRRGMAALPRASQ